MYDGKDFSPEYEWHLMPGFKFPRMPIPVRLQMIEIRDASIKNVFKIKWIEAIASLFDDNSIYAEKPLDSKKNDAEIKLSTALTFADQNDLEIDVDYINKDILQKFETYLINETKE